MFTVHLVAKNYSSRLLQPIVRIRDRTKLVLYMMMVKNPIAFFFVICNSYSVTDAYNVTGSSFDQHQPGARISIQSSTCTFASIGASKPPTLCFCCRRLPCFYPRSPVATFSHYLPRIARVNFVKGKLLFTMTGFLNAFLMAADCDKF